MREVIIRVSDKEFDTYFEQDPNTKELIRCKKCIYFEYDHVENVDGIPLIVAHEICKRWSEGVKTSEDGYCFLGVRKGTDEEQNDG